ncbi:hypothetical protein ACFOW4_15410 [Micromonospora sp. GCM10011542]|uniref:ABC transporter permease subunit n=1 Tax=Micromonospora sp. GCM10011542 TaxID=3317337 RepID=UPI00361E4BB6
MAPFIVTLASLLGARGQLLAVTDEGARTYLVPRDSVLLDVGRGTLFGFGWPVYVAVLLCVAGAVLLQRTRYGQAVFALGGNEEAAALMGLPVTPSSTSRPRRPAPAVRTQDPGEHRRASPRRRVRSAVNGR